MIASVSSAGTLIAIPSAIVGPVGASPAYGAHAAAWTPTSDSSGRSARSPIAIPPARPPPPTGITTVPGPGGSCSASSSPSVPWPATTRGSSNACTNVAPVDSTWSRAAATASSNPSPPSTTDAPYPRAASTFAIGAPAGTKIVASIPARPRRPRDGLPVVPGARGHDSLPSLRVAQLHDRVVGAADLERARQLEVLGLERHVRARSAGRSSRTRGRASPAPRPPAARARPSGRRGSACSCDALSEHDETIRSTAVSGSSSRRSTAATSSATAGSAAMACSIRARTRAAAAATTSPRRFRRRRSSSSPAAARASRISTSALHSSATPSPRSDSVRTTGGRSDGRSERQHSADVGQHRLRAGLVHLVDRDHVRDLHDPRLERLDRVARAGHQHEHHLVSDAEHLHLPLTGAHGLEEDDVLACGVEEQQALQRGLGEAARVPAGAHGADEDTGVEEVAGEPDPVAEKRPLREGARRVDGDDSDGEAERADMPRGAHRSAPTSRRRAARSGRSRRSCPVCA